MSDEKQNALEQVRTEEYAIFEKSGLVASLSSYLKTTAEMGLFTDLTQEDPTELNNATMIKFANLLQEQQTEPDLRDIDLSKNKLTLEELEVVGLAMSKIEHDLEKKDELTEDELEFAKAIYTVDEIIKAVNIASDEITEEYDEEPV